MSWEYNKHSQNSYEEYLLSPEWEKAKSRAVALWPCYPYCSMDDCDKYLRAWHHYKGYEAIWSEDDYQYIAPTCKTHHTLCHYTLFGKVPLLKRPLMKRYKQIKGRRWGRWRPSTLINWLAISYGISERQG